MVSVCISWALRKKKEIESTTIDFDGENMPIGEDRSNIYSDENDLKYTSEVFQAVVLSMLKKIVNISVVVFAGMSVIVWVRIFKIENFFPSKFFQIFKISQKFFSLKKYFLFWL